MPKKPTPGQQRVIDLVLAKGVEYTAYPYQVGSLITFDKKWYELGRKRSVSAVAIRNCLRLGLLVKKKQDLPKGASISQHMARKVWLELPDGTGVKPDLAENT